MLTQNNIHFKVFYYYHHFVQMCASQRTPMLVHSLPMKRRKRLVHDVIDNFFTHPDPVYDSTDAKCWAQNGSTHGCAFANFKLWFWKNDEKQHQTRWEIQWKTALCAFYISLLAIGSVTPLLSGFPLTVSKPQAPGHIRVNKLTRCFKI